MTEQPGKVDHWQDRLDENRYEFQTFWQKWVKRQSEKRADAIDAAYAKLPKDFHRAVGYDKKDTLYFETDSTHEQVTVEVSRVQTASRTSYQCVVWFPSGLVLDLPLTEAQWEAVCEAEA